ncbi:AraC family transcriptional regulator [Paenibacillus piscarius]|uniref:AraC family transcriptional regulator n=1 Tax=Paenibacillus piscarius TaxID=1089681 RepID=UPI001EE821C7|nr:AraC family transcriptional regulator [Paenibacillus piscarius]
MNRNDSPPQGLEPGLFMYNYKSEDVEAHWFHAHRGIEMLYIYSGHGEIMAENETYPIRDHTLVWFQPYQLHRVHVPQEEGRSYLRTNLTFDPGFMEHYLSAFPYMDKFFRSIWKGSLPKPVMYDMQDSRIPELLEELHQYMNSSAGDTEEHTGFLLLQLIRLLQQRMSGVLAEASQNQSRGGSHVGRITEWLEAHYREPFSLEALAAHMHLSPYHISHLFKQYAGITLSEYIVQRRVREACILLANTDKSVGEIAMEVGGLSPSYFSQMFKKLKGISPEKYRKSIR